MKNECYALIVYGYYEDTTYEFIKIDESEKEKFKQFCLDSQNINGSNGESIELLYWVYNIENCKQDSYDVCVFTIHELQDRFKESLDRLDKMKDRHYLYKRNVRIWFEKLLEYNWL